jgi:hypothetical protein
MRFITMPQKDWEEWRANWCFLRFSEVDDPMAYTELTSAPEALPIWTSPASMAGLEATVERIQLLRDLHLAAHHVLNSFIRHNIMLLQQRSCPHWEVLCRNHPTRLHQESPSSSEIITVSNFLDGGNQKELSRPQGVRLLI